MPLAVVYAGEFTMEESRDHLVRWLLEPATLGADGVYPVLCEAMTHLEVTQGVCADLEAAVCSK